MRKNKWLRSTHDSTGHWIEIEKALLRLRCAAVSHHIRAFARQD